MVLRNSGNLTIHGVTTVQTQTKQSGSERIWKMCVLQIEVGLHLRSSKV